jgi:hypothetical protein
LLVLEEELGGDRLAGLDVPDDDGRHGGAPLVVPGAASCLPCRSQARAAG